MSGTLITSNHLLCTPGGPLRPRRPHRRARIAKKWQKRYGWVMKPCPGNAFEMMDYGGRRIVCCPCVIAAVKAREVAQSAVVRLTASTLGLSAAMGRAVQAVERLAQSIGGRP